ncbi:3-oxoacyl-ACP reductase [Acuticoccus sediminis]|uniref:3-oxoacyl-ACP reductase n=1 Tax=Acuticoccus sediminis TaxID=2184697 RepID=A0A8B2NIK4_9HYPH|nr:SDR family NAD(P)-dependent oxidoreductase [Acuticoccus sediminis]RAH97351.1 3-oxoacyl-ACP reductase [Acuticoccus sediminis]
MTAATTFDLTGRRAVITGGGGCIGAAVAERMAALGADVEVWDLKAPDEWATRSRIVDVTDAEAVHRAMDAAAAKLGGLDVLVCAAGITGPTRPASTYSAAEWRRVLDINLDGTFYCVNAALRHMEPDRRSDIVCLASIAGKDGNPGMAAYSAAKAGVIAMVKSIGRELALTQIRTHAIAPALIETGLLEQMDAATVAANLAKIPMGRAGTPGEVAELAAWLMSSGCSFTTGAVHDLSGGRATY